MSGDAAITIEFDESERKTLRSLRSMPLPERVERLEQHDLALGPMLVAKVALIDARGERLETAFHRDVGSPRVERRQVREGGRESIIIEPATGVYAEHEKTRADVERSRAAAEAAAASAKTSAEETLEELKRIERRLARAARPWAKVQHALAVAILAALAAFSQRFLPGAPAAAPPAQHDGK